MRIVSFLTLWYAFNAGFNVTNKQLLNQFAFPWVVSWFQLAIGLLYVLPAWKTGIKKPPKVSDGAGQVQWVAAAVAAVVG